MMRCPFSQRCKYKDIAPEIIEISPRPAKYMFLFDKIYGVSTLLSSALESLLNNYLEKIGLKKEDVYMTSLSKCRKPPTKYCLGLLPIELKTVNPEKIIIFGSEAGSLLGIEGDVRDNRIKYHDVVIEDMFVSIRVAALVTHAIDKLHTLTAHSIYDTISLMFQPQEFFPESEYITDPNKLFQELTTAPRWSFDFETAYDTGEPYSMAISTEQKNYYIEFSDIPLRNFEAIFKLPNRKVIHSQYELTVLKNARLEYDMNFADTWLYSYIIDPNRDSYSLKNLVADYFHQPGYGVEFESYQKLLKEQRRLYNVRDSFFTLKLYNLFQNELSDTRTRNLFKYIVNPFMHVLHDLNYYGVRIDETTLNQLIVETENNMNVLKQQILTFKSVPKDINLDSPKQLADLIYTQWGLEVHQFTKNKQPSTSHEALMQLSTLYKRKQKVLELIADYSAVSGIYGLLKQFNNLKRGGKVYSKYWPHNTATGRLSSENPNMQNIPPHVRSFVIPNDGVFFDADVSQSDVRMLAQESGDPQLIKSLEGDIHRTIAAIRYNKPESEITDEERKSSKAITFGFIYGISEFGLARQLNISQEEAAVIMRRLMSALSGVYKYWSYIKSFVYEHGYVESMYGRRRYFTKRDFEIDREGTIRQALNAPIQSDTNDTIWLISSIIKKLLVDKRRFNAFNIQIHDEIVIDVKEPIDDIFPRASEIFISTLGKMGIKMKLPIILEYGYGMQFGQINKTRIWTIYPDGSYKLEEKIK